MSYCEKHTVALTTTSGGAATGYTPVVTGRIVSIAYTKTDFVDGVDFTITTEDTAQTVWTETNVNASKTVAPLQAAHSTAGVAATYDGTYAVGAPVYAAGERIKIVIASGGDTKTGTITVVVA